MREAAGRDPPSASIGLAAPHRRHRSRDRPASELEGDITRLRGRTTPVSFPCMHNGSRRDSRLSVRERRAPNAGRRAFSPKGRSEFMASCLNSQRPGTHERRVCQRSGQLKAAGGSSVASVSSSRFCEARRRRSESACWEMPRSAASSVALTPRGDSKYPRS